jgi:hypothetical protein
MNEFSRTVDLSDIEWRIIISEMRETSPTIEQLTRISERMPVLVYEKEKIAQYFHFIKRYRRKLVFAGKLNVVGILLLGLTGFWYVMGTKYHASVTEGLFAIMAAARLDDRMFKIVDWFPKKGRLELYVCKEN